MTERDWLSDAEPSSNPLESDSAFDEIHTDGLGGARKRRARQEPPASEYMPAPEPPEETPQEARVFLGSLVAEFEDEEQRPLPEFFEVAAETKMDVVEVPSAPVGKASESTGWRSFFQGRRSVAADIFEEQVEREREEAEKRAAEEARAEAERQALKGGVAQVDSLQVGELVVGSVREATPEDAAPTVEKLEIPTFTQDEGLQRHLEQIRAEIEAARLGGKSIREQRRAEEEARRAAEEEERRRAEEEAARLAEAEKAAGDVEPKLSDTEEPTYLPPQNWMDMLDEAVADEEPVVGEGLAVGETVEDFEEAEVGIDLESLDALEELAATEQEAGVQPQEEVGVQTEGEAEGVSSWPGFGDFANLIDELDEVPLVDTETGIETEAEERFEAEQSDTEDFETVDAGELVVAGTSDPVEVAGTDEPLGVGAAVDDADEVQEGTSETPAGYDVEDLRSDLEAEIGEPFVWDDEDEPSEETVSEADDAEAIAVDAEADELEPIVLVEELVEVMLEELELPALADTAVEHADVDEEASDTDDDSGGDDRVEAETAEKVEVEEVADSDEVADTAADLDVEAEVADASEAGEPDVVDEVEVTFELEDITTVEDVDAGDAVEAHEEEGDNSDVATFASEELEGVEVAEGSAANETQEPLYDEEEAIDGEVNQHGVYVAERALELVRRERQLETLAPAFADAFRQYHEAWDAFRDNEITIEDLRDTLGDLYVTHNGQRWQLGFQSGLWYREAPEGDVMRWVRGQPPTRDEYEAEVAAARAAELADLEAKMKEAAEAAEKVLGEYATGELTYDQATAALAELGFEHDGRIYRIGAKSGNWYVETETGYQFAGTTAEDLQGGDAAEEASEEE